MKTENLYIECESLEQAERLLQFCLSCGFKSLHYQCSIDESNIISVRIDGERVFIIDWPPQTNATKITYTQFMEKYAMQKFKEAVAKAKGKFKVDNTGLSRMLGYHRDYINEALKDGRSTKWQEKTIAKIEALSKGVVLDKVTVEIDAKFSPELQKVINDTKAEIEKVSKENTQLKKDKEQLVVHNGKSEDEKFSLTQQIDVLQRDKVELVNQIDSIVKSNKVNVTALMSESDNYFKDAQRLKQDKDSLKGQIVSLEKINSQYKNKYAASVTIGLMIASILICIILWGVK